MDIYINIDALDTSNASVVSETDLKPKPLKQFVAGTDTVINLYTTSNSGATDIRAYYDVRLGIGPINQVPTSGSYQVNSTTSSATATINYNDSVSAVNTAFVSILDDPFTLTELAPQTYKLVFTNNGNQAVPSVTNIKLFPASTPRILEMKQGTSSTPAQWLIQSVVDPIAYTAAFANISGQTNGMIGSLNTGTAGVYRELQGKKFFKSTLEVEVVDLGSKIQTILQAPITIRGEVVRGSLVGFSQIDSVPYALDSNLIAHTSNTSNPHSVTKTQVGLGNVDNTSDADKPVSTAVQTELDDKASVVQLNAKAPIASPTFTGTVTAPQLVVDEIQNASGQAILYDSFEHRFRDHDAVPTNLLVIKKTDGQSIGKVGINHNNPVCALHVVGGHTTGGMDGEALRVIGSALVSSTNASTLVLAMDTDNSESSSDAVLKIKRDEGTNESPDVEEVNIGFVGADGALYSNSTVDSTYIKVEKGRKLEIATGQSPAVKRMAVSDAQVEVTNDFVLTGSSASLGIRTPSPSAALDVNGSIKASSINVDSKAFYVDGTANYIQAEKYGEGTFAAITGSENQPKTTPAFGNNGKVVEKTFIKTLKIQGTGFTGLGTAVQIVAAAGAGKYNVPLEMTVFNDYGTRAGEWGANSSEAAIQIGTFQNSDNTGNFAPWLTLPVSTAENVGDWLSHKTFRNIESKQFSNRDIVIKGLNYPSSEANAPDGSWYIRIEYMVIGESGGFENNVDQTIGTAF